MIKIALQILALTSLLLFMGCDKNENSSVDTITQKKSCVEGKKHEIVPMQAATKILRITPDGTNIQNKKEIVLQFDREMVPLGDMARREDEINIDITPKLACEWRWLSRSALACRLNEQTQLTAATVYKINVNKIISLVDGVQLDKPLQHAFMTLRPTVAYVELLQWSSPGIPYLSVHFNVPVTKASVLKSLELVEESEPAIRHLFKFIEVQHTENNGTQSVKYLDDHSDMALAQRTWVIAPTKELVEPVEHMLYNRGGLVTPVGPLKGEEREQPLYFFQPFDEFTLNGIRCYGNNGEYKTYYEEDFEEGSVGCNPLYRVGISFNVPVLKSMVAKHLTLNPSLNGNRKDYDPWANSYDSTALNRNHKNGFQEYVVWLPERLKAFSNYTLNYDASLLKDEFGRTLKRSWLSKFKTSHRDPALNVPHSNVVLEKGVKSYVPLYATNIDRIDFDFNRLLSTSSTLPTRSSLPIETMNVVDISYKTKVGVRNALNGGSGALYGTISSPQKKYAHKLFAQVTPFQVHVKLGHFNSLVWVTSFATGEPVEGASISLQKGYLTKLDALTQVQEAGESDEDGRTDLFGTESFNKHVNNLRWLSDDDEHYFVKVEKDGDMALVPLTYEYQIHDSSAYAYMNIHGGHDKAWGTTAQGVYKVGDKVAFKIYVRSQNNVSLTLPSQEMYTLEVRDPMDKVVYTTKEKLSSFGAMEGNFQLAKSAAVGEYSFYLTRKGSIEGKEVTNSWHPMRMLVSDFTPASFGVKTELNGEQFSVGDTLNITSIASMYSGGPYTKAETRVSAHLFAKPFRSNHPLAKGFSFSSDGYGEEELLNIKEHLNNKGEVKTSLMLKASSITYGELLVESSVKDERGKYVASKSSAIYTQRDRFVGLKETKWVYDQGKESEVKILVVDDKGVPAIGTKVNVKVQYRSLKSTRVKGSGNAFVTQSIETWVDESNCSLDGSEVEQSCLFKPMHVGSYRFIASIKDSTAKENSSTLHSWVSGAGAVVWDQGDNSNLAIIPESSDYKVGEKARFLVKNPYPGAKALVTIERYGILHSWVETLETGTPIIEFEVKPEYIPGFYLSVVVVSPRVQKPLKEGMVDLGKPSYKMGYVVCDVKDKYKTLSVDIKSNKTLFEPGEKAEISLHVEYPLSKREAEYEIALVAIDASVLALNKQGTSYYDPYKGFNTLDSLDVTNYSLLSRLMGRQKFEKKGANQGGDGGASVSAPTLRNDFKYIAYWNPSIVTDAKGDASISFTMPDNLTGWKIMAMVVSKDDKMGLGQHSIKTNKSTELRAVMPNQVLKGDTFSAGFNVMNRTDKQRAIEVVIDVLMEDGKSLQKKATLQLDPFSRENVYMPIQAKVDGKIVFNVKAFDKVGSDGVEHILQVHKRSVLETMSNFGTTLNGSIIEEVSVPKEIIADVGEVGIVLSSSVVGNTEGAFTYIKEYPYWCWEQRLTKAVAAAQYRALKAYLPNTLKWEEAKSLTKRMLEDASSFQAPNGGMAFWIGTNDYVNPYLSAYTALEFAWLKKQGYQISSDVEEKLHHYLKKMLTSDVMPSYFTKSMSATVRAVALNALAMSKNTTSQELNRYARHSDSMSLFGKANYLQALLAQEGSDEATKKRVLTSILATSTQSAGKFSFNEEYESSSSYLLATPMRANCAILSSLVDASKESALEPLVKDIAPKLVRTITQTRGQKDHWENTQENIFCMNAIIDYAKVYEATPINMSVDVSFDNKKIGNTEFTSLQSPSQYISTPITPNLVGKKTTLKIDKAGTGRLYYVSRISFARNEASSSRVNSGIEVRREYSLEQNGTFELLSSPMKIKQGDIVRVDLFVSLPTARNFVVVDDAVPGGLEPINADLATTSVMDARKGDFKADKRSWWFHFSDWSSYGNYGWSFYHKELRHDSARFYADYLPAGNYHLSYTSQAIAEGEFSVMPTLVEEMYDPDVYGLSLPLKLHVTKE